MEYTFTCVCGHITKVEAMNDDQAVSKLMTAGKEHAAAVHPDMADVSMNEMEEMVRSGMKK